MKTVPKWTCSSLPVIALALALSGCGTGPKSATGFRLPDGNAEKGKAAFVSLQCHSCHEVKGVALPSPPSTSSIHVILGGDVPRAKTYGQLVTAVIHPSHQFSSQLKKEWLDGGKLSPMPEYHETMTVAQMIDLVAFLQPHYHVVMPDYIAYP